MTVMTRMSQAHNALDAVERHIMINTKALDDLTFEQNPDEQYAGAYTDLGQGGK